MTTLTHPDLPARWNTRELPDKIRFLKKALAFENDILRASTSLTQTLLAERQQEHNDAIQHITLQHQLSTQELRQQYERKLQTLQDTLTTNDLHLQEQLRTQRTTAQEQIQHLREQLAKQHADYHLRTQEDAKLRNAAMERERHTLQERINELRQQVADERNRAASELTTKINEIHAYHSRVKDNSAIAGQYGEKDYLVWAQTELTDVDTTDNNAANLKHIGDFIHEFSSGVKIMVDTKNYTHPVSARERRKLAEDLRKHPDIDAGVLLSYQSCVQGFAGDTIFSLERLDDGRPILYIHHFGRNRSIYIGILRYLVRSIADAKASGITDATALRNRIDTCLREHIQPHIRHLKSLRKSLTDLEQSVATMEQSITATISALA